MADRGPPDQPNVLKLPSMKLTKYCPHHLENKITKFCCQHEADICNTCYTNSHMGCGSVVTIEKASVGRTRELALENSKVRMKGQKEKEDLSKSYQVLKSKQNRVGNKPVLCHSFETSILKPGAEVFRGCFLSNQKLILSDRDRPLLYVCNINGSDSQTIRLQHDPWDVELIDDKRAIVTLKGEEGYQILDLKTFTLGKCIKPGENGCNSVSCREGQILVSNGAKTVLFVDLCGKIKYSHSLEKKPWFIYQCCKNSFYYNMFYDDTLYKLTAQGGEEVFYRHPELIRPAGIAGDSHGNIYVSANGSSNVHRITLDGLSSDIILSKEDGISEPWDLCCHGDSNQLLVVNEDFKRIEIYDLK